MTMQFHTTVDVPVERMFAAMTDFPNATKRVPAITNVEMLTDGPIGVGTKFKETRMMFKREATETMEVTKYVPNQSFELSAHSHGVDFATEFRFTPESAGTRVDVIMNTQSKSLFAKIMGPLMGWMMKGTMKKCMLDDIAACAKSA